MRSATTARVVVAAREELDGEIERRQQALERLGDGVVVARGDPIGGQHAVGERHQREVQVGDLVGGGQRLRGAREGRAAAGHALDERRGRARRAALAVPLVVGPNARLAGLRFAEAHAGRVELAVDLQRLVVVGEAEVGHAARRQR